MDPINVPPTTPPIPDIPQPQVFVGTTTDATDQPTNYQTPDSSRLKSFTIIGGIVLIIVIGASAFFLVPKMMTARFASSLKPKIISLKNSTALVKTSVNAIHYDITQDSTANPNDNLRSSGLLIHPQVASLLTSSDVLGISTKKLGLLELTVLDIQEQVKGKLSSLVEKNNVAADSSSADNPYNARFRMVKDETQKANSNITQAQSDFTLVNSNIQAHPLLLSSQAQNQIINDPALNTEVKPYLDQAQKVSNYYQNLSNMLIDMNTKIDSFKTSLNSTATTFSQLKNPNLSTSQVKTILSQSQIYLDQAKKDTKDIKDLTQNLKKMSNDSLPHASDKYQAHNIQVLETVGNYFDEESVIMQSFIDETNSILLKSQSGQLNSSNSASYLNKISTGGQKAALADTKFISDLNSLIGEEASLTISFWQDNGILNKGDQVELDLNRLQQNLNTL